MRAILDPPVETLARSAAPDIARVAITTVLGFALYGFTVGYWRSPVMGLYVAVKMPLLIACTLGCNGLLNGLLGILLGSNLGFRQSLQALLGTFAISALILGSVSPVTLFLALNAPAPDSPQAAASHAAYQLSHTALIAIAGVIGAVRLGRLLDRYCPSRTSARATLACWIAGNAFLGAQFSWILRPFFGSPGLEVAFLRPHPLRGSFYEDVWRKTLTLTREVDPAMPLAAVFLLAVVTLFITGIRQLSRTPSHQP
jgi:hypothetical protein